ncbi:MAG TPA: hypothetical protein VHM70_29355 [Polyangiaceae bacterium]|nr:hypothetical protein [Polyangiaceae bacterium]
MASPRVIVPLACCAAVFGAVIASITLRGLLRRKIVLLELTLPPDPEAMGPVQPTLARSALAAGVHALWPPLADALAHKVSEVLAARLDHFAPADASAPGSAPRAKH